MSITRKISFALIASLIAGLLSFASVSAKSVEKSTWDYYRSQGFSKQATAAVLGNIKQETNFNQKFNDGKVYGLYLFHDATYSGLAKYAKKKGKKRSALSVQNSYFCKTVAPKNFKTYTGKTYKYSNGTVTWWPTKMTIKQFKKLKDVEKATKVWERVNCRSANPKMKNRIKYAKMYYNAYK